jgi:hypothetical protein
MAASTRAAAHCGAFFEGLPGRGPEEIPAGQTRLMKHGNHSAHSAKLNQDARSHATLGTQRRQDCEPLSTELNAPPTPSAAAPSPPSRDPHPNTLDEHLRRCDKPKPPLSQLSTSSYERNLAKKRCLPQHATSWPDRTTLLFGTCKLLVWRTCTCGRTTSTCGKQYHMQWLHVAATLHLFGVCALAGSMRHAGCRLNTPSQPCQVRT